MALLLLLAVAFCPSSGLGQTLILDEAPVLLDPRVPRRPAPPPGPGQLALVPHAFRVDTQIRDGIAVTRVDQTFRNPLPHQVEGLYLFPLPEGAAVGDFTMTVGGKTLTGDVLDADAAWRTYEDIVRRTRDPGLLEYAGGRLYRARVFPIPPHGLVEISLQYTLVLTEHDGLGAFRYPLRTLPPAPHIGDHVLLPAGTRDDRRTEEIQRVRRQGTAARPASQIVISVHLKSSVPLLNVFCPSHECDILRKGDNEALVGFESGRAASDRDFVLYYQRQERELGLALLAHREAGQPGTFLLRIAPRVEPAANRVLPKDVAFVIDTSGSMAGEKMVQAQRALKFCLNDLGPEDRFNIHAFSTGVRSFREELVPADGDSRAAAGVFVDDLKATGGTNINSALREAFEQAPSDATRVYLVLFVTDGLPTVDVTSPEQILENVARANTRQVRLHVLGVGTDVNTHLLDKLAESTRGSRDYCTEGETLELKLSALARRLARPLLTDLRMRIDGAATSDVYPPVLPDLFCGSELSVMGRYDGHGGATVHLVGQAADGPREFKLLVDLPRVDTECGFLPRLWANRKLAYLLDQIRLHGSQKELIDEVIRLATRYGIVTPYTSSLALDDEGLTGRPDNELRPPRRRAVHRGGGRGPAFPVTRGADRGAPAESAPEVRDAVGAAAVHESAALERLKWADHVPSGPGEVSETDARRVLHVGDKTFRNDGGRWTDTAWDGKSEPKKLKAFSDEYFALLRKLPQARGYFALGPRVLVMMGNEVYETVNGN